MNGGEKFDLLVRRDQPGLGDDIACSKCGAFALDTGCECDECGHDMLPELEALAARPSQPGEGS